MMNVLKRGVLVGRVLVPNVRFQQVLPQLNTITDLCGGSSSITVVGLWHNTHANSIVEEELTLLEFCMFNTTRLHEVEPLLLDLANILRQRGEQSVMLWLRRDGQLVPHLYEES